jgi:hypothetical protein
MTTDTSDKHEWMKVLEEWMYILESGSFNTSLLSLDLPSTEELPMVRTFVFMAWDFFLPLVYTQFLDITSCVKTPTNQILWAALDTIMQVSYWKQWHVGRLFG